MAWITAAVFGTWEEAVSYAHTLTVPYLYVHNVYRGVDEWRVSVPA